MSARARRVRPWLSPTRRVHGCSQLWILDEDRDTDEDDEDDEDEGGDDGAGCSSAGVMYHGYISNGQFVPFHENDNYFESFRYHEEMYLQRHGGSGSSAKESGKAPMAMAIAAAVAMVRAVAVAAAVMGSLT